MNIAKGMRFAREVKLEATRITWPNFADTRMMTLLVFVLVFIIAMYLMMLDFFIVTSMNWLLGV